MAYLVGNKRNDVGLVLHIDPANIKCFRGEPTSNLVNSNWSTWSFDASGSTGGVGTRTIDGTYCKIIDIGQNSRHSCVISGVTNGGIYTFSVKYRNLSTTAPTLRFQIQSGNVVFPTTSELGVTNRGDWQIASYTFTTASTSIRWFIQDGNDYTNYTHSFEIKEPQLEQKDHVTHFTSTSRGTTTATNGGLKDLSMSLNNATITNTLQYINNTMYFNGTSDVVLIPSSSSINFTGTDDYTMVAWVKPVTGGVTWYGVFSKGNENSYAMNINSSTWYLQFEIYGTGSHSLNTTTNVITPNAWNFIVMLYDGVTQKIFVNGILLNSQSKILGTYGNTSDLRIGLGNNGEYFKGYMGDLRLYNRGLRDDEVVSMYNSSKSRYN